MPDQTETRRLAEVGAKALGIRIYHGKPLGIDVTYPLIVNHEGAPDIFDLYPIHGRGCTPWHPWEDLNQAWECAYAVGVPMISIGQEGEAVRIMVSLIPWTASTPVPVRVYAEGTGPQAAALALMRAVAKAVGEK